MPAKYDCFSEPRLSGTQMNTLPERLRPGVGALQEHTFRRLPPVPRLDLEKLLPEVLSLRLPLPILTEKGVLRAANVPLPPSECVVHTSSSGAQGFFRAEPPSGDCPRRHAPPGQPSSFKWPLQCTLATSNGTPLAAAAGAQAAGVGSGIQASACASRGHLCAAAACLGG
jgi:hypothetical protein